MLAVTTGLDTLRLAVNGPCLIWPLRRRNLVGSSWGRQLDTEVNVEKPRVHLICSHDISIYWIWPRSYNPAKHPGET